MKAKAGDFVRIHNIVLKVVCKSYMLFVSLWFKIN